MLLVLCCVYLVQKKSTSEIQDITLWLHSNISHQTQVTAVVRRQRLEGMCNRRMGRGEEGRAWSHLPSSWNGYGSMQPGYTSPNRASYQPVWDASKLVENPAFSCGKLVGTLSVSLRGQIWQLGHDFAKEDNQPQLAVKVFHHSHSNCQQKTTRNVHEEPTLFPNFYRKVITKFKSFLDPGKGRHQILLCGFCP